MPGSGILIDKRLHGPYGRDTRGDLTTCHGIGTTPYDAKAVLQLTSMLYLADNGYLLSDRRPTGEEHREPRQMQTTQTQDPVHTEYRQTRRAPASSGSWIARELSFTACTGKLSLASQLPDAPCFLLAGTLARGGPAQFHSHRAGQARLPHYPGAPHGRTRRIGRP